MDGRPMNVLEPMNALGDLREECVHLVLHRRIVVLLGDLRHIVK